MGGNNSASVTDRLDSQRRTFLRAVGAGTTLSLFGAGAVQASEHRNGSNGDDAWCPPCIDRLAGYTLLEGEDQRPAEPDHVVDMYIEPRHVLFEEVSMEEVDEEPVAESGEEEMPEAFPDFFFDPVGLRVEPGAVVEFYNASDLHTVTAFHPRFGLPQRVPDGSQPFSSPPIMGRERWLYQFNETGVYDLLCFPHFELGMVMRLIVLKEGCDAPDAEPLPESEEEGLPPTVQAVLSASELEPTNIVEQGSVAWDDLTIEERIDPATFL